MGGGGPGKGARARATLAGGCFWCTEAIFQELRGVESVEPGYSGGHVENPTYEEVCTGTTGHAESVQLTFDPSVISYADLLRIFFTVHDPTTRDRQGHDVGPQYRSVIFFHDTDQEKAARDVMREVSEARIWKHPLVTELVPFHAFYPAEEHHRDYFRRNPGTGYCSLIIAPKVAKFRARYADRLRK